MHQFHSKEEVLRALLEQQFAHFDAFSRSFRSEVAASTTQSELVTQIATSREIIAQQHSVAQAMVAALAQDPSLLADARDQDAERLAEIRREASDPDLAVLRWAAARGLALLALLRLSRVPDAEPDRLFARLLDDSCWKAAEQPEDGQAEPPEPRHG
jgi:AcrR family transcriptional regulator